MTMRVSIDTARTHRERRHSRFHNARMHSLPAKVRVSSIREGTISLEFNQVASTSEKCGLSFLSKLQSMEVEIIRGEVISRGLGEVCLIVHLRTLTSRISVQWNTCNLVHSLYKRSTTSQQRRAQYDIPNTEANVRFDSVVFRELARGRGFESTNF